MADAQPLKFSELVGGAAIFGVAGWALENMLFGERYSALFKGAPVPFLPIYAAGGATVLAVAPTLRAQGLPWPVRGVAYAGILTGLEWAGCQIDRKTLGVKSWDYGEEAPADGCIDIPHAIAWGVLGLLAESFQAGNGSPRG